MTQFFFPLQQLALVAKGSFVSLLCWPTTLISRNYFLWYLYFFYSLSFFFFLSSFFLYLGRWDNSLSLLRSIVCMDPASDLSCVKRSVLSGRSFSLSRASSSSSRPSISSSLLARAMLALSSLIAAFPGSRTVREETPRTPEFLLLYTCLILA